MIDKSLARGIARMTLRKIAEAGTITHRVGGSDIGVRHIVASYVLNPPPNHRTQLLGWGFDELKWRSAFFEWVAPRFTWERWIDASERPAPAPAFRAFEVAHVKGASLAWPGDGMAMQILDRAAQHHGRRDDRWLRFQTVLHALVETTEADEAVRSAVMPLWQAVKMAGDRYDRALRGYYPRPADGAERRFSDLDISPRVLNMLETRMRSRAFVGSILFVIVLLPMGCSAPRAGAVDDHLVTQQLDFLDRKASREEIEARLGAPAAIYEQDAVVSYQLYVGVDGRLITAQRCTRSAGTYTLVLQYGSDGRVLRHALLRR